MKQVFCLLLLSTVLHNTNAQNVGIGTETPMATLDVNGDVIFRVADLILPEDTTLVLDVNTTKSSVFRISGPVADFFVSGITAGQDGRLITLLNRTGFAMTLISEDPVAEPADRIITGTASNVTMADHGIVTLQYDVYDERWVVKSTNRQGNTEGVWDTIGDNAIFNDGFVGIGTDIPVSPLTMVLDSNGAGITQIGGLDSITLTTAINAETASIGTTTDHVFSLHAGGTGKLHVWPDGNVVIGDDIDPINLTSDNTQSRMDPPPAAKLTLETELNKSGWVHVGASETDTVIVDEAIGGVSSSLGTLSNHTFRLKTNAIGRLQILPDGRIVVGDNNTQPAGQFTVYTGEHNDGLVHTSTNGFKLATHIGVTSGTIGTYSNHHFRLVCNSQEALNIVSPSLNVGIGVSYPNHKLEVNGTIRAREIIVEAINWPDYVFQSDYHLRSLDELEHFIQVHKHLPDIPSALEIESSGLYVGATQKIMMEKIEELTLYVIALKKEIDILKQSR